MKRNRRGLTKKWSLLKYIIIAMLIYLICCRPQNNNDKNTLHHIDLYHIWTGPFQPYHKFWAQSCKKNLPKLNCILITDQHLSLEGIVTIQEKEITNQIIYWLSQRMTISEDKIRISMEGIHHSLIIQSMKHYFSEIFNIESDSDFIGFGDMDQVYGDVELLFKYNFWKYEIITISQAISPQNDRLFTRGQFTIYQKDFKNQFEHEECFRYLRSLAESGESWDIKADEGCFSAELVDNVKFLQLPIAHPPFLENELVSSWAQSHEIQYDFISEFRLQNWKKCVGRKHSNPEVQKAVEAFARCSQRKSTCPVHREERGQRMYFSECSTQRSYLFLHFHVHKKLKMPEEICAGDMEISRERLKCI